MFRWKTLVLIFLLILEGRPVAAQDQDSTLLVLSARADSLRQSTEQMFLLPTLLDLGRAQIAAGKQRLARTTLGEALLLADGGADQRMRANVRLAFAQASGGTSAEAISALEQAALLADSASDRALEREAQRALVRAHAARGSGDASALANARAEALTDSIASDLYGARLKDVRSELDSARGAQRDTINTLSNALVRTQQRAEADQERLVMYISILIGVLAVTLIALAFLLRSLLHRLRKLKADRLSAQAQVSQLTARIEALERSKPTPAPPAPVTAVPQRPIEARATAAVNEDEVLSAMFLRMVPEKLEAFREARSRGDQDKCVRVLRSMRSWLLHQDAVRFGALFDQLAGLSGPEHSAQRDALFDRFEHTIVEELAQPH